MQLFIASVTNLLLAAMMVKYRQLASLSSLTMMQRSNKTLKVAIKPLNMLTFTKSTWKQNFLSTVMEILFFSLSVSLC